MIIRVMKKGKNMQIQTGMVFNDGIAIYHTFDDKIKEICIQTEDKAVSDEDRSMILCKDKNNEVKLALPFEFLIVEKDAFREFNFYGDTKNFEVTRMGGKHVFSNKNFTKQFMEKYAKNITETLKLTDEEWNERKKDKEDEE